jgi:hypothetical protein
VSLAFVVVEEHARAAVQLADDDALGTIDDEGTGLGHQRDLTEVDFLLLDVAHDALATLSGVVDHELRGHLDGGREGHAALATLVDVVLGLFQVIGHKDQLTGSIEVLDGEDATKDRLQPNLVPL